MIVMLKVVLDCDPDAAWHALRSPAALREVVSPWLDFASLEAGGFPAQWPEGEHLMTTLALRTIAVGTSAVDVSYPGGLPDGVRMLRDTGGMRSGPGAIIRSWDHRMAVSPDPAGSGGTLYRDRLRFGGPLAAASWYPVWLFWQWRAARLRQLAPTWSAEGAATAPPATAPPASGP
ncbi:hypothetical protein ASC66_03945 [Leifsonia sp. Root4]|uniref:hypothetical protein n=1 Tax=Leifsonia sp. Root4 TaxID=1736525 RepID=UPI0006F6987E|nr:hypothetical protein [Leifsonia sp. Root4]KQW08103.1 hypothetical protein ASC66_03945 [Leifsonia sp. Root4]